MLSGGSQYARQGCATASHVQLPFSRSPCAPGPPLKAHPGHGESSPGRTVRGVPGHVFPGGAPFHPPEKLLRALLLQILYTIRSARLLMEQLDYNLLLRWFVGLSMDDKVWDHSVFSNNPELFLDSDLAAAFFARILKQAASAGLLSDEHFTVDGTLIEAWASLKSFPPKD